MEINIVPSLDPDFTLWGKPRFFDFKTYPGAVVLQFENDVVMTLPLAVFNGLRFSVPDQRVLIASPEKDAKGARVTTKEVAEQQQAVLKASPKTKSLLELHDEEPEINRDAWSRALQHSVHVAKGAQK